MERDLLIRRARAVSLVVAFGVALGLPAARADSPAQAQAPSAQAPAPPAWEKIGDDDGIAVYRREVPGSPIIAFKGDGIINAPTLRVASILVDTTRATEWVDSLVEARTLRHVSETEYIEYDHIGTPFVMKDRDF